MTKKQSPKTPKTVTILKIVDHIIEVYKPLKAPILLMWRETINGFNLSLSENSPVWSRDDGSVHEHWKRFGPGVVRELDHKYHLTVVKVSRSIRKRLDHGQTPDRDDKRRTDEWYRGCLPGPNAEVMGIVLFPKGQQEDHPLVFYDRDRREKMQANGFENSVKSTERAKDCGTLSDDAVNEIHGHVIPVVKRALEDKYPLFSKQQVES
jgi:hypothetical protein